MNNKVIFSSRQFSIQDLLTSASTVLVLLRHFAWLPWRDHVAQVEACKAEFEAYNGQVVVISFGNVVSIKLACFADWLSRYIVLRVSIDSRLNRRRSRRRVQGVYPPPEMTWGFPIQLLFCNRICLRHQSVTPFLSGAPPAKKNPESSPVLFYFICRLELGGGWRTHTANWECLLIQNVISTTPLV